MSAEAFNPAYHETVDVPKERPRLALIAGGGGGAAIGPELIEQFPGYDITIVTGIGDGGGYEEPLGGGATREIRQVFGGGAPGDLRHIISAVSGNQAGGILERRYVEGEGLESFHETSKSFVQAMVVRNEELAAADPAAKLHDIESIASTVQHANQLADYLVRRTGRADMHKHTWGNVLLTALRLEHDRDIAEAAKVLNSWMETKATVLPSTKVVHDLIMQDGDVIKIGEGDIDLYQPSDPAKVEIDLEAHDPHSEVTILPEADEAIAGADTIIVGPGSPFTSQLSILKTTGMQESFRRQRDLRGALGKVVLFGNLVEEDAAKGMTLGQHGNMLAEAIDRPFDLTIFNNDTESLPEDKVPLKVTENDLRAPYAEKVIGAMLLSDREAHFQEGDEVARQGRRSTTFHHVPAAAAVMRQHGMVPTDRPLVAVG